MLSEKKAINSLKPWWEIAYSYGLVALVLLALAMLLVSSGFGRNQGLYSISIINEIGGNEDSVTRSDNTDGNNNSSTARFIRRSSESTEEINVVMNSRGTPTFIISRDSSSDQESSSNLTKEVVQDTAPEDSSPGLTATEKNNNFRFKRSLRDVNVSEVKDQLLDNQDDDNLGPNGGQSNKTNDVMNAFYTLVIFSCMWLIESAFSKVFYSDHLIQTLVHLMSTLSDVREFQRLNHGLIFANTLHHSFNRSSLWTLFWANSLSRMILTIVALSLTSHFHLSSHHDLDNNVADHTKFSLGILTMLTALGQCGLSCYGLVWPWMVACSPWGHLMLKYSESLTKIDVARGRCVPVPSAMAHSSRFSLLPSMQLFKTSSSILHMKNASVSKTSIERIVDALNPYTASPNIHLVLDLVAYKSGVGVALRNLAFLEIDVHNNWRPFRPSIQFTSDHMEVSWRDPLAILYLTPVPAELQLHYGIEISCQRGENTDKLVEIVGYQETRYFRQIWHYHHARGSVEGSTMTLDTPNANPNVEQTKDSSIEAFTYRESFSNIYPQDGPVQVVIWTIVDGQLIAKNQVNYFQGGSEHDEHDQVDESVPNKPPRVSRNESGESSESVGGSSHDGEASPSSDKVSSNTKVHVESEVTRSLRRRSTDLKDGNPGLESKKEPATAAGALGEGKAKSLTNLKQEDTSPSSSKSKRISQVSGERVYPGILRKVKSVGTTLASRSTSEAAVKNRVSVQSSLETLRKRKESNTKDESRKIRDDSTEYII